MIVIFCLLMLCSGIFYYFHLEKETRQSKYLELQAVGNMKAGQISEWYQDELDDIFLVSGEYVVLENIRDWFLKQDQKSKDKLLDHFFSVIHQHGLKEVLIMSPSGRILLSTSENPLSPDSVLINSLDVAFQADSTLSTDLYLNRENQKIYIDFIAPLHDSRDKPIALLVFRVDPDKELYPKIAQWPNQSLTAESMMFRPEGDSILFMNELKRLKQVALRKRISFAKTIQPSLHPVGVVENVSEGVDDTGNQTLSHYTPIAYTPWFLISKIDIKEAYQGVTNQAIIIVSLILLIVLSFGLSLMLIYTRRQRSVYRSLFSADKELKKLSSVVQQTADMVFITNKKGVVEYANPAFEALTGYTKEEIVGQTPRILRSGEHDGFFYEQLWRILLSGKSFNGVFINRKKSGELYYEDKTISPLFSDEGEVAHYVSTGRDITSQIYLENDLLRAKEKAEESDRLKTAFLNNISHEVRTPLNGIMGFSYLLTEPGISDIQRQEYIRVILQSSNQLLSIITSIIQIATIEAGQEKLEEANCNISQLIRDLFSQFVSRVDPNKIQISCHDSLKPDQSNVVIDKAKLIQILSNLMDNAVKFTEKGEIKLSVFLANGKIKFSVEDTGVGIPPEYHKVIFDRFRQVETGDARRYGGNGLGLSVSRAYVDLMGGSISVSSVPDQGSRFEVTIPYKPVDLSGIHEKTRKPESQEANTSKSPTLLIAEDQENNFLLINEILKTSGYQVIHVLNGAEAVEVCRKNRRIDLVLMDMKMPVMDGYEATTVIKKERPDLPVIAVTAFALRGDRERAMKAGCNDYISKPFRKKELLDLLERYLKN